MPVARAAPRGGTTLNPKSSCRISIVSSLSLELPASFATQDQESTQREWCAKLCIIVKLWCPAVCGEATKPPSISLSRIQRQYRELQIPVIRSDTNNEERREEPSFRRSGQRSAALSILPLLHSEPEMSHKAHRLERRGIQYIIWVPGFVSQNWL